MARSLPPETAGRRAARSMLRVGLLALILALGLLPGAVGAAAAEEGDAARNGRPAETLTPVRVQLKWRHQFQFAGFYAAIEKGFYRDAGLAVTLVEYSPGVTPIDQLIGGRVDYAVADTGALIYRATGVPLVALAAVFQQSPSILLARADRGVEELADLEGQPVMLSGGYMNAELMAMLASAGIGPNDFDMRPSDPSLAGLIDGRVKAYNAYVVNEPYLMERRGVPYRIFQPREHGVDFYGDLLITTETKIDRAPDEVAAFRAATLKGWRYAAAHPEELVDVILANYNTQDKSRAHLLYEAHASIDLILSNVVPVGYMNAERWARIGAIFLDQGLIREPVDIDAFLYEADEMGQLLRALRRYSTEIAIAAVLTGLLLLVAHNLHLRARVEARTRELREAKRRAEAEARHDPLTGLANRRAFEEVLSHDLAQTERRDMPLTVMILDVDHFKRVNDSHGHAVGDAALQRVAEALRRTVRSGEIAARIGGEEFAVLCPGSPIEEARQLAERLRRAIADTDIRADDATFRLTASFGLAARRPSETPAALLKSADAALYTAKQAGRDRIAVVGERAAYAQDS